MSNHITKIDFDKHNEEAKQVWDAYYSGKPTRVPMILGINPRFLLLNPELNTEGITFEQYSNDPDIMARVQCEFQHYIRHNILQDAEMGLPKNGWNIYVDLQNYYEAAWFGAEVHYRDGQVPDTTPILNNDNKRMLFDKGIPDPFTGGVMARAWQLYEQLKSNIANYSYADLPVIYVVQPHGLGTDGPMTVACSLRGATEFCTDLYEDPKYAHELLRYITEATIYRIKEHRKVSNQNPRPKSFGFADDSIELLSVDMYKEFVLPYHKMLISELAGEGPHSIHLCGDVDRLIPVLQKELNINFWDAGFPINYKKIRSAVGDDLRIQTGPKINTLLNGTPEEVDAECKHILESGITSGGKFVLREANNLSPCTPIDNLTTMYEAARKYGTY